MLCCETSLPLPAAAAQLLFPPLHTGAIGVQQLPKSFCRIVSLLVSNLREERDLDL